MAPIRAQVEVAAPAVFEVGGGSALLLRGYALREDGRPLRRPRLALELGDLRREAPHSRDLRLDVAQALGARDLQSGFYLLQPIPPSHSGRELPLRLTIREGAGGAAAPSPGALTGPARAPASGEHELLRQRVRFVERLPPETDAAQAARLRAARVVICLATYEPDLRLLRRQLDSLRDQTVSGWACLLRDDASSDEAWRGVQALCGADPRFVLLRGPERLGFYRNFEACLRSVPASAPFVALCDQDDRWHPEKLATLLARMAPGVELAYSDMRVVDEEGRELAPTFWTARRNQHDDLAALLVSNTVTGAASLLRGSLLRSALPFPAPIGAAFHDHWLACVALCAGRIDYVDRPLYDYTQHGRNALGHRDTGRSAGAEALRLLRAAADPRRLGPGLAALARAYYDDYRRLQLYRAVLRLRFPALPASKQAALDLFDDSAASAARLLGPVHLRAWRRGGATDLAECWLGLGLLGRRALQPLLASLWPAHWRAQGATRPQSATRPSAGVTGP